MSVARLIVGDVLETLAELPENSVDLVLTSPPFLALRSYLPDDHPDKDKEIGSERTPAEFMDVLLDVVEACDRVLTPHGSLVFELGDTYSGSGGAGGDYAPDGLRAGQPGFTGSGRRRADREEGGSYGTRPVPKRAQQESRPSRGGKYAKRYESVNGRSGPGRTRADREGWPLDKSLCGIPQAFELSLAWGRNILRPPATARELLGAAAHLETLSALELLDWMTIWTDEAEAGPGRERERWRVRNLVAWCRPNPPTGALSDKFRPGTSYLTVACHARDRYFDQDAVRRVNNPDRMEERNFNAASDRGLALGVGWDREEEGEQNPGGAPPLDWWKVTPRGYDGSHYATWPPELLHIPILSMCPQKVCTECGKPSRRIVETKNAVGEGFRRNRQPGNERIHEREGMPENAERVTIGWTDCGHGSWRNGVVLDPFAGSGTTLAVATGHGRDALGIDLDERNVDLVRERVGMFLTVEEEART